MRFNEGDKVRAINVGDYVEYVGEFNTDWKGKRGTVIEVHPGRITVRWNGDYDMANGRTHNFKLIHRKPTDRWKSPFHVGDVVRMKHRLGRITSVCETGDVAVDWGDGGHTRYNHTAAKLHLEKLNQVSNPTAKTPETAQELNVQLLTPIKVENQTVVTLPGFGRTKIEDLNNDQLVGAIQQAEAQIEELKKLRHQPKVIKKQIIDLEAGIKAIVDLLDTRFDAAQEKPAKKQGS